MPIKIKESALVRGDVLFFRNHYMDGGEHDIESGYVDHVALYAGKNEAGLPMIIHSISSEKGHYHPDKLSGLCTTTLRALRNQLQREEGYPDRRYDVSFHVFRSNFKSFTGDKDTPSIAEYALRVLEMQARYRLPYDEKRLDEKISREDSGFSDEDFQKFGEENYPTQGIYRSIKYAARFPLPLTRTRQDGVGRGLTCSMAVILAFQIAELMQKNLVCSIGAKFTPDYHWVSDKYGQIPEGLVLPARYQAYLKAIRKDAEKKEEKTALSYTCWQGEEPPEEFRHETFPVDAKSIGAAGLYLHMQEQHKAWQDMGELDTLERAFSPDEKTLEIQRRRASFFQSLENLAAVARKRAGSVSPSPSLSPHPRSQSVPWYASGGLPPTEMATIPSEELSSPAKFNS